MPCLLGGGFLNSRQINRINAFIRKAHLFGLCSSTCICDVSEYLRMVDSRLFSSIQSPFHCLSQLLPPEKQHFGLRPRGHSYALSICQNNLCKRSFISDVYFVFFNNCVLIFVSSVAIVLGLHNICIVICYLSNKEIASYRVSEASCGKT